MSLYKYDKEAYRDLAYKAKKGEDYRRWDLERLETAATNAVSKMDEKGAKGGLLGGLLGAGAGHLATKYLLPLALTAISGGTLNPATMAILSAGVGLLGKVAVPGLAAAGAGMGSQKIKDEAKIGRGKYGTNPYDWIETERELDDYAKAKILSNQITAAKTALLAQNLLGGGNINMPTTEAATATGGVQSQIPNMTGTAPATLGPSSGTVAPTLPGAADLGMTSSTGSVPANDLITSISPDSIDGAQGGKALLSEGLKAAAKNTGPSSILDMLFKKEMYDKNRLRGLMNKFKIANQQRFKTANQQRYSNPYIYGQRQEVYQIRRKRNGMGR